MLLQAAKFISKKAATIGEMVPCLTFWHYHFEVWKTLLSVSTSRDILPFSYHWWWPTSWHARLHFLQYYLRCRTERWLWTELNNNASKKFAKYCYCLIDLLSKYHHVKFANWSADSLGIFGVSCDSFIQTSINQRPINHVQWTNVIIWMIHFKFCMRNKPCTNPELLSFLKFSPSFSSSY